MARVPASKVPLSVVSRILHLWVLHPLLFCMPSKSTPTGLTQVAGEV